MKKDTFFITDDIAKRFNTTWKFRYDVNAITPDTIFFNGFDGLAEKDKSWYFNAPGGESGDILPGTVSYTYINPDSSDPEKVHDSFKDARITSNPNAPQFEYDADNEEGWDLLFPNNKTRFLAPAGSDSSPISFIGTVENVYIDTTAPVLTHDLTQYAVFGNRKRTFRYIFTEDTLLDYKNFSIKLGNRYLYQYVRKTEQITWDKDVLLNVSIKADGLKTYMLEFVIDSDKCNAEMLNAAGLTIEVYDIAGNAATYKITKQFYDVTPDSIIPLEIHFYNQVPEDHIVKFNQEGEVWVDIYNPNEYLWNITPIAFRLEDLSIGVINENTIDDTTYAIDGHVKFKVDNIHARGAVIVDAWLETDDEEWHDIIKTTSFAVGTDEPWILMDERNRLYSFTPYIPKVVGDTDYAKFVLFVEKFLNTYYTGLSGETCISALEKTARILDFKDILQVEKEYLYKYANEMGNELDISFQDIIDLNTNIINNTADFEINTYDDAVDVFRHVMLNLPYYNQLKGTLKGTQMILRAMGLCVSLINLWLRTDVDNEVNPVFFEQNQIDSMTDYFMSSYFTVNASVNTDFRTFNDNIAILINLIRSIKPITQVLESIKYTVTVNHAEHLLSSLSTAENIDNLLLYTCSWNIKDCLDYTEANAQSFIRKSIYLPYHTRDCIVVKLNGSDVDVPEHLSNAYTLLSKLADKSNADFVMHVNNETCVIPFGKFTIRRIDTGILVENISGEAASKLYSLCSNFDTDTIITVYIKYLKGTDNIFATDG